MTNPIPHSPVWTYTVDDDEERYRVPRSFTSLERYPEMIAEGLAEERYRVPRSFTSLERYPEMIAEGPAGAIFDDCDWKNEWPLEIRLFRDDVPAGHYRIEMHLEPQFTATALDQPAHPIKQDNAE